MARKTKDEKWAEQFAQHLQPDETLLHVAFGVKQPHMALIIFMIVLAVLPGILITFLLTKNYLVAMTNKRLLVAEATGSMKIKTKKPLMEINLDSPGGEVITSTGMLFTHIKIKNPDQPFKAKFHRAASKKNKEAAMAIADALQGQGQGQGQGMIASSQDGPEDNTTF